MTVTVTERYQGSRKQERWLVVGLDWSVRRGVAEGSPSPLVVVLLLNAKNTKIGTGVARGHRITDLRPGCCPFLRRPPHPGPRSIG